MTEDTVRPYADIAERLRIVREATGLRAYEFAERAGIKRKVYENWESGRNRISTDGAIALREAYNISLDFIFCASAEALPHKMAVAWASRPRDNASSKSNVKPDSSAAAINKS